MVNLQIGRKSLKAHKSVFTVNPCKFRHNSGIAKTYKSGQFAAYKSGQYSGSLSGQVEHWEESQGGPTVVHEAGHAGHAGRSRSRRTRCTPTSRCSLYSPTPMHTPYRSPEKWKLQNKNTPTVRTPLECLNHTLERYMGNHTMLSVRCYLRFLVTRTIFCIFIIREPQTGHLAV